MDHPQNFPDDVLTKMRELYTAGVVKDYTGGAFFGGTGWWEADELLSKHRDEGWLPDFTPREHHV